MQWLPFSRSDITSNFSKESINAVGDEIKQRARLALLHCVRHLVLLLLHGELVVSAELDFTHAQVGAPQVEGQEGTAVSMMPMMTE